MAFDNGYDSADDELPWIPRSGCLIMHNRSFAEPRRRIAQSIREEAMRRLELSACTTAEFQTLVHWYDREEQSRMRRKRRYENLRGDAPLEYGALTEGDSLPSARASLSSDKSAEVNLMITWPTACSRRTT